jgi:hypothetical protein
MKSHPAPGGFFSFMSTPERRIRHGHGAAKRKLADAHVTKGKVSPDITTGRATTYKIEISR